MTGPELRLLRANAGLTQRALGIKVGYPAKTAAQRVWDNESGRKKISAATATLYRLLLTPATRTE